MICYLVLSIIFFGLLGINMWYFIKVEYQIVFFFFNILIVLDKREFVEYGKFN